ncbi:unnamed protein product [Xylocopa violacea]|uniref:Uncharacterized protein n=1 Tax=Xylocopa violacea TaxID=135666 RepID=A0ABP1NU45_XYLVO
MHSGRPACIVGDNGSALPATHTRILLSFFRPLEEYLSISLALSHSLFFYCHTCLVRKTCTTEEPLRKAPSCSSRRRHRASGPGGQPVTRGYGAPRLVPVRMQAAATISVRGRYPVVLLSRTS